MTTANNSNLNKAKKEKNDEFYTQYEDIEKEINAYVDHNENVFRDKVVLLPCDDPTWSNFTKYFVDNFDKLGIKKLISSCKALDGSYGKVLVIDQYNKDITKWKYLNGDGDFRSDEVTTLRNQADFVITNPPFSLFREFLAWIVGDDKKFALIGNMNAITYREVFPLIKENKVWLGATGRVNHFISGSDVIGVSACWLSNIEFARLHKPLQLKTMNENLITNKRLIKKLNGLVEYQVYDNYNAIDVPFTNAIPSDYDGVMGVPISFLDKYCPEQFEIVSANDYRKSDRVAFKSHGLIMDGGAGAINGKPTYVRILIKHK